MEYRIRTRIEALLAMIAGESASIEGFVPPVLISTVEKLLGKIATRIDNIEASEAPVATDAEVEAMLIRVLG